MLTTADINEFSRQALDLILSGSMPSMIGAALAGLAVAILQALTQIQDQGLPTAIKFFAVMGVLYGTYVSLSSSVLAYSELLFNRIATL